jgi:hypothetical protein
MMKHVKLFEDFIVSLSEHIIENEGSMKVYDAGNFYFDNKNAAQKYLDLLKKLTFEYNTGDSRLYSRGPIYDAFEVDELMISADSIQEGLDDTRADEGNYYSDLRKRIANTPSPVPADLVAEAKNILAPFIKHFSVDADFKFIGTNSVAPSLQLKLYANFPNSDHREYKMPGTFLNEKDAKQALNFAMKNAIAYPITKDYPTIYVSLDKLSPRTLVSGFEIVREKELRNLAKSSRSKNVMDAVEEFISFQYSLER